MAPLKRIVVGITGATGAVYGIRLLASGSVRTAGIVIGPCSIKPASAVGYCRSDTLIGRAADVTVTEGRPLREEGETGTRP